MGSEMCIRDRGIAKKLSENGAELAFTYLGDALKKRVTPLAESVTVSYTHLTLPTILLV